MLIVQLAIALERLAQHALHAPRPSWPARRCRGRFHGGRARFEPTDADGLDGEVDQQRRAVGEEAGAPVGVPMTKPHSAVSNLASSWRTWKMPTAVSVPAGTTAKQA